MLELRQQPANFAKDFNYFSEERDDFANSL